MSFLRDLDQYRLAQSCRKWVGTFADYLELVRRQPWIAQLSHSRIYRMIVAAGVEAREGGGKRYRFFSRDLFGLDDVLEKLVEEYFRPAAHRLDVRKRILLLMGPVGGGKSTLVTLLKRGLERYSGTEEGALFAIQGCPMHEEPLHLIPQELRPKFTSEFNIPVEGELCPSCRLRLETEYGGRIEEVLVERILLSEERRIGIGTFSPSDPKSQDIAELTGSIDFSTIAEYGAESDPRAYRFDGELNIANRGIIEFQEILKCDERFLWNLLSLSQEGNFKTGRFALISADEVVIAHTNEAEYRSFVADRKNEALISRLFVLRVSYNLSVSEEVKIYEKLIRQSDLRDIHLAPFALRAAAIFSVLSRLRESRKPGVDLLKKMRLYDGEEVEGIRLKGVAELKTEHPDEGMSGVDPRYVVNRLSSALIRSESGCVTALDVLRALRDGLDQYPFIGREEKERLLDLIALARQEYDEFARREVERVLVHAYEESARLLFENYLDNVEAFCGNVTVCDLVTGKELEPDEKLMRSIEEQIGISENARKAFREEILIRISTYARKGKKFDYTRHPLLREAIEKKLFADLKDVIKVTAAARHSDPAQLARLEWVKSRLVAERGFCPTCAGELLRYVGSLLGR